MKNKNTSLKRPFPLSRTMTVFLIVVLLFFLVGVSTLGSFRSTKQSCLLNSGMTAVFELSYGKEQSNLCAVYVNIGNTYIEAGADATITFKRKSASGATWLTSNLGTYSFGNIYSQKGSKDANGNLAANYEWLCITNGKTISSAYTYIQVSVSSNTEINEIVFLADNGTPIEAKFDRTQSSGIASKEAEKMTDAQNSLRVKKTMSEDGKTPLYTPVNAFMFNFTDEEKYTLTQIHNVKNGSAVIQDAVYTADNGFNSLGTLAVMLGTCIFGESQFGLRIVPFLATVGLLVVLFYFARKLFKNDFCALVFLLLFAIGGLALTVGRIGAAYSLIALCLVSAFYCMSNFIISGIQDKHRGISALVVLAGFVLWGVALCMDSKMLLALPVLLGLFIYGMYKQKKAYVLRVAHIDAEEEAEEERINALPQYERPSKEAAQEKTKSFALRRKKELVCYDDKTRYCILYALTGAIAVPLILLLLAGLTTVYAMLACHATASFHDGVVTFDVGVMQILARAFAHCFTASRAVTADNGMIALGWFFSAKGATLWTNHSESIYAAFNAQPNILISLSAAVAFIFSTLYVCTSRKNGNSSAFKRICRTYAVLLCGMLTGLLPYLVYGTAASAVQSLLFYAFYIGFIPLAIMILSAPDAKVAANVPSFKVRKATYALFIAYFCVFLFALPMLFGFPIPAVMGKILFSWMTLANNGFFRI